MSSVRDRLSDLKREVRWQSHGKAPLKENRRLSGERWSLPVRGGCFRPRISIQLWLTVLFLLVAVLAGATAYSIVAPRLGDTLQRSADASFRPVGDRFEEQLKNNPQITEQYIRTYAINHGVQWGIVRGTDGSALRGNLENWDSKVVSSALEENKPKQELTTVPSGDRKGQTLATYASPIKLPGESGAALVFARYYTQSDIQNPNEAMRDINRYALLAGALALLIIGFSGYAVANRISRRLNRLDVAARRLAASNFDERITTRIGDEVGSLGETFNATAS
jgi:methyl-accepting chemotaxis protein